MMEVHEPRFNTVTDAIRGYGIILLDREGKIRSWNDGAGRMHGYLSTEIVGQAFSALYLVEDARRGVPDADLEASASASYWESEGWKLRKGGVAFWARTSIAAYRGASGLDGYSVVIADLTEQKRSADMLRFLTEASALLIGSTLDYEQTMERLSRIAIPFLCDCCRIDLLDARRIVRVEWACAGELKEKLPEPIEELSGRIAQVIESGVSEVRNGPETLPSSVETLRKLGLGAYMIIPLVTRGKVLGAITFYAISNQRQYAPEDIALAQELCRRAAATIEHSRLFLEARNAVQSREHMVATVSHDLKNPLAAVIMGSRLIARMAPGDENGRLVRRQAETILFAAERMNDMIRDLLQLAQMEAGKYKLRVDERDVRELVESTLKVLRPLAEEKNIELRTEIGEEISRFYVDHERILQVLSNLLGNAVKFTSPGGTITIGARVQETLIEFFVRDNGPGIPEEVLPHIFDRFWQMGRRDPRRGSGLGLSIAKGIVEAHNGRIWVDSKPGRGSTFYFTIPLGEPIVRVA